MYALDVISCQITNMNKKKGQSPRKPSDQFQPDYVAKAKDNVKGKKKLTKEEMDDLADFFNKRNNNINKLERSIDGS